jgi:hypothetical protein
VVTATGFNMSMMGEVPVFVDGRQIDWSDTLAYRTIIFPGVPNLFWTMGYFRGSWTMRVELVTDFVCNLLRHMEQIDATRVEVRLRPEDENLPWLDWIDNGDFNPGYLQRSMHLLPKRIDKPEWTPNRHYTLELAEFPNIDFGGPEFVYGGTPAGAEPSALRLDKLGVP